MSKSKSKSKSKSQLLPRWNHDIKYEIGIDESGRGPLFGRVYAAAVVLPNDPMLFDHTLMTDSKKIKSPKKMATLAEYIRKNALSYSIQYIEHDVIDRINILQADIQAMHNCIRDIMTEITDADATTVQLVIDGNYFKPFSMYQENSDLWINLPHHTAVKGDDTYSHVAAASILAKWARDEWIHELCRNHPELHEKYGLDSNMGYGTKRHLEGIIKYGLSPWHRRSFTSKLICK
jgi:ribonuclease HII